MDITKAKDLSPCGDLLHWLPSSLSNSLYFIWTGVTPNRILNKKQNNIHCKCQTSLLITKLFRLNNPVIIWRSTTRQWVFSQRSNHMSQIKTIKKKTRFKLYFIFWKKKSLFFKIIQMNFMVIDLQLWKHFNSFW